MINSQIKRNDTEPFYEYELFDEKKIKAKFEEKKMGEDDLDGKELGWILKLQPLKLIQIVESSFDCTPTKEATVQVCEGFYRRW